MPNNSANCVGQLREQIGRQPLTMGRGTIAASVLRRIAESVVATVEHDTNQKLIITGTEQTGNKLSMCLKYNLEVHGDSDERLSESVNSSVLRLLKGGKERFIGFLK